MRGIYRDAIETFGARNQIIVCIEELSELQKELCKHLRGDGNIDHIAEELADVEITIGQLREMFRNEGLSGRALAWRGRKIERLAKRVAERKEARE